MKRLYENERKRLQAITKMAVTLASIFRMETMEIMAKNSESEIMDIYLAYLENLGIKVKSDRQVAIEEGFTENDFEKIASIGRRL